MAHAATDHAQWLCSSLKGRTIVDVRTSSQRAELQQIELDLDDGSSIVLAGNGMGIDTLTASVLIRCGAGGGGTNKAKRERLRHPESCTGAEYAACLLDDRGDRSPSIHAEREKFLRRYFSCGTREEREALATELGLRLPQLYNLASRLGVKPKLSSNLS